MKIQDLKGRRCGVILRNDTCSTLGKSLALYLEHIAGGREGGEERVTLSRQEKKNVFPQGTVSSSVQLA